MRRVASLAALFVIGSTRTALAQSALPLDSGARVRVWSSSPHLTRRVATVVSLHTDSLRLTLDWTRRGGPDSLRAVTLPMLNVTRLDVSRGRHGRGRGALRGALIGLAVFGTLSYVTTSGCAPAEDFCILDRREVAIYNGVIGASLGAIIGALVRPGERWERMRDGPAPP